MAEPETTTAIAQVSNVPEVLQVLEERIKNLKKIEDQVYKTSGVMEGFGDLKKETKIENLIRAFSMVRGKHNAYNEAADDLGLKSAPQFSWCGGTVEDWKQDIKLRIETINYQDTLNKLKEYKDKMSRFLSEEDQKKMLLSEMSAFLGSTTALGA